MATTRFKGETAGERLDYSSISDSDMLQLRHKPGTIEDEDKGISKSQLLSCPFGVSSTAAGTAAKTASLTDSNPDFILVSGREVVVCFTTANTASNPTLNFAGSGAIPIYYPNGSVVGAWDADTWMHLKYFYATVGNTSIQRWILMSPLSVDIVAPNSKVLITSGGVASAIDIPKDAVLHYSFDEVPDYPDGTATQKRGKNFTTSDIGTSQWHWSGGNNVATVENGILTVNQIADAYFRMAIPSISASVIKIRFRLSQDDNEVSIYSYLQGETSNTILKNTSVKANEITDIVLYCNPINQVLGFTNLPIGAKLEILGYYIGDGSYSTPIIDNASGQNNATNNGGIAIKGISGKGVYFLNGKYAQNQYQFDVNNDFSISFWVKPDNNTIAQAGYLIRKTNVFHLFNGEITYQTNSLYLILWDTNNNQVGFTLESNLLPTKWSLITLIRNNNKLLYYRDGVKLKEFTINTTLRDNTNPFFTGYTTSTRPQSIDDFQIFDRALTENEVMALYLNKANTPKYYSWADWKLEQMTNITRSIIEQPSEEENREDDR